MRKDYRRGWWSRLKEEVYSIKRDLCMQGSCLAMGVLAKGNKEVKLIKGSKRMKRRNREGVKKGII